MNTSYKQLLQYMKKEQISEKPSSLSKTSLHLHDNIRNAK